MSRNSKSTRAKRRTASGFLVPCRVCGTPAPSTYCVKHVPTAQRSDLRSRLAHEREVAKLRSRVLKRDKYSCVDCGVQDKTGKSLECDHIVPWAEGGPASMENLQTRCLACHRAKTKAQYKPKPKRSNPMR